MPKTRSQQLNVLRDASLSSDWKDLETAGVSRICKQALYICVRMLDPRGEPSERQKKTSPRNKFPSASLNFKISFIYTK